MYCDCVAITFHLLRLREALQYHQEGDAGRAVAKLTRAIALDPRRPELFKQRAEAQLALQNFHSAIINFKKALSLQPSEELELTERCVVEFSNLIHHLSLHMRAKNSHLTFCPEVSECWGGPRTKDSSLRERERERVWTDRVYSPRPFFSFPLTTT